MNAPSGGEFNRLDRAGDYMEGDLQLLVQGHALAGLIEFLQTVSGLRLGGIRQTGNDLEFYDVTTGVWTTLSSLKAGGLVAAFEQEYITVGGETGFTLTGSNSYVPGTQTVWVNRNGILLPRTEIVETSPTRVDLAVTQPPVGVGEKIVVFVMAGTGVDTFAVKGDAADGTPSNLDDKLNNGSGLLKSVTGSPANSVVELAVDHATATPLVESGTGAVGSSTKSAREDHVHPEGPANPPLGTSTPLQSTGAGSAGSATDCSREDHVHPAPAPTSPAVDEMKNATLVHTVDQVLAGTGPTKVVINLPGQTSSVNYYYWASAYCLTGTGVTATTMQMAIGVTGGPAAGASQVVLVIDYTGTGVASNNTFRIRVFRVDET